jgi:hypothetical protein
VTNENIIKEVKLWVDTVVIDLNLCPFAKRERDRDSIRYVVSRAISEEDLLIDVFRELELLNNDPEVETTLLIHPFVLINFLDFNQFLSLTDALLVNENLDLTYQIASFHPQYQFAENEPEDAENYTNRSPYPMLHLLREASLDKAIDAHSDIHGVPKRNCRLLREMGSEQMKALLRACFLHK